MTPLPCRTCSTRQHKVAVFCIFQVSHQSEIKPTDCPLGEKTRKLEQHANTVVRKGGSYMISSPLSVRFPWVNPLKGFADRIQQIYRFPVVVPLSERDGHSLWRTVQSSPTKITRGPW